MDGGSDTPSIFIFLIVNGNWPVSIVLALTITAKEAEYMLFSRGLIGTLHTT